MTVAGKVERPRKPSHDKERHPDLGSGDGDQEEESQGALHRGHPLALGTPRGRAGILGCRADGDSRRLAG